MDNDRWLRQEVEREKSKIARFIETQERRQDNLCVREHGLLKKLQEKEKKIERNEKTLAKTRKEANQMLAANNA